MKPLFSILLLWLALNFSVSSGQAQPNLKCVVCDNPPPGRTFWKHTHGTICRDCVRLDLKCDICGLPIKADYLKTKDGRYICKFEKDDVVVDEKEAMMIYDQAVSSVLYVSGNAMALRGPKPDVRLFDIDYWNSGQSLRRGGFSQSRIAGRRITHNIILLSGLPKDELVSVSAHEYTHLWINENKKPNREIEKDTIEGLCELVAYKVCERAGFTNQLARIKKNPYTNGRILTMLEAERQNGFARVLEWVRTGTSATMNVRNLPRAPGVATTPRTSRPPVRSATRAQPRTSSPKTASPPSSGLKITSIARTNRGYRAQINGVLFYRGDLKRITYNGRPVNLHCLRVTENSATVSVNRGNPHVVRMGN
ncbi:MAG: protein DA1 [Limisphaerales bacterium]